MFNISIQQVTAAAVPTSSMEMAHIW